jgi:hypothetical protein
MSSSQEYRWFAARCLELERHAADAQTRAQLLQMAQISHRLADEFDATNRSELHAADQAGQEPTDVGETGVDPAGPRQSSESGAGLDQSGA